MKKLLLFCTLLLVLPFVVKADIGVYVCKNSESCSISSASVSYTHLSSGNSLSLKASTGQTFYATNYVYHAEGKNLFCVDAANLDPSSVNKRSSLSGKYSSDKVRLGLLAVYRLYLLSDKSNGEFVSTNDAMRFFIARSIALGYASEKSHDWGYSSGLTSSKILSTMKSAAKSISGLDSNSSIQTSKSDAKYIRTRKYYCAAAKAAGYSDGNTSTCKDVLKSLSINKQKVTFDDLTNKKQSSSINVTVDQTTVKYNKKTQTTTLEISAKNSTGAKNIAALIKKYPSLNLGNNILTVNSISCPKDYDCTWSGGKKDLIYENQVIKIVPKDKTTVSNVNKISVSFNLEYHFSWDIRTVEILSGNSKGSSNATQNLLVIEPNSTVTGKITLKNVPVHSPCESKDEKDGKTHYFYDDEEVNISTYIKKGCCAGINIKDFSSIEDDKKRSEAWNTYNDKCLTPDDVCSPSDADCCTPDNPYYPDCDCTPDNPYYPNCDCTPDDPNYPVCNPTCPPGEDCPPEINLEPTDSVDLSKESCGLECNDDYTGVKNVNSEKDNTASVMQYPMDNILKSVSNAEASLYKLLGVQYTESDLNKVYDAYSRYVIDDSNIPNNKYCKVYSSENLNVIYPGYALASSGRYFVFEDDSKPKIKVDATTTFHINTLRHDRDVIRGTEDADAWNECTEYANKFSSFKYKTKLNGTFSYEQSILGQNDKITTTVNLSEGEKNLTNSAVTKNEKEGRYIDRTIKTTGTITMRPEKKAYDVIGANEVVYKNESEVANPSYVDLGYKYFVKIEAKKGQFETKYTITGLGNYGNVDKSIAKFGGNQTNSSYSCVYCNRESELWRECDTCPNGEPEAGYVYRVISLDDVESSIKDDTEYVSNWGDDKGKAAASAIEKVGNQNLSAKVDDKYSNLSSLENNGEEVEVEKLEYIYSDNNYLEYEFNLNTSDLQIIKENNKNYLYGTYEICDSMGSANTSKSEDAKYCYSCAVDGKECKSTFVTAFSEPTTTEQTRNTKWKYFFYNNDTGKGSFVSGSINTLSQFATNNGHSYNEIADAIYNDATAYKNLP